MAHEPHQATRAKSPSKFSIIIFFFFALFLLLLFWFGTQAIFRYAPRNPELDPDAKRAAERLAILKKIQEEEATQYNRLAWKDPSNGIVQIPVPRAMELIVQRAANNPPREAGWVDPARAQVQTPSQVSSTQTPTSSVQLPESPPSPQTPQEAEKASTEPLTSPTP